MIDEIMQVIPHFYTLGLQCEILKNYSNDTVILVDDIPGLLLVDEERKYLNLVSLANDEDDDVICDIENPASVNLTVRGTKFTTAKKAAVLVSSTAGAVITASKQKQAQQQFSLCLPLPFKANGRDIEFFPAS